MIKYTVGQELYYVRTVNHGAYAKNNPVVVTKVGRVWIYINALGGDEWTKECRFDPKTMRVDGKGYASPGIIYPSKEAYENEQLRLSLLWQLKEACDKKEAFKSIVTNSELKAMIDRLQQMI